MTDPVADPLAERRAELAARRAAMEARDPRLAASRAGGRAVAREPEPPLPSAARQLGHLVADARVVAGATVRGEPVLVPSAVQEARLRVCRAGDGLPPDQTADGYCDRYRPSDDRCSECGCYLGGIAGRSRLAGLTCPLGRWPEDLE